MAKELWRDRERRTGRLIRTCFLDYFAGKDPDADLLHALCGLTWITKAAGDIADNTRAVVTPALSTILGLNLTAADPTTLGRELRRHNVPENIARPASEPIGFVNFYTAFRNTSRGWITENLGLLWGIFDRVANASHEDDVRNAYVQVQSLAPLPRKNAGDLPAYNLVTPVLACLDPRRRAPIINSRKQVRQRLGRLGLSNATLIEQYLGLRGLIGQAGIDDAFALDTADDDMLEKLLKVARGKHRLQSLTSLTKVLDVRSDEDVEYLRDADTVRIRRRHNQMTNALRTICHREGFTIEEGTEASCMFDALIKNYAGAERHLLVEVKTESTPPFCRMAVGQLLDYRRLLPESAAIDLAVLLLERPSKDALDFFGYVGIAVAWFNEDLSQVEGQVRLEAA